jgi:hypothetical protein
MLIMSINQLLMCNKLIVLHLKMNKKKRKQCSLSLFLSFKTRNVSALHLHASFAVHSYVFDSLTSSVASSVALSVASSVTHAHSCISFIISNQRLALLSIYMQNLFSAAQHHKITFNVYHKNVSIKQCKKCLERNVKCIKIKFSVRKKSKKCALYIVFKENCKYES